MLRRALTIGVVAALLAMPTYAADAPAKNTVGSDSGLPLPRFVSMSGKETNVRSGPGTRYPILWVYKWQHLPVEIIDEHENWRQVRDINGDTGWLHRVLLSGNRHVLFREGEHEIRENPEPTAKVVLRANTNAHAQLLHCVTDWCQVQILERQGWAQKQSIFGAYPTEMF